MHDLKMECVKPAEAQCLGERQVGRRLRVCKQSEQMISSGELRANMILPADGRLNRLSQVGKKSCRNDRSWQGRGTKREDVGPKLWIHGVSRGVFRGRRYAT